MKVSIHNLEEHLSLFPFGFPLPFLLLLRFSFLEHEPLAFYVGSRDRHYGDIEQEKFVQLPVVEDLPLVKRDLDEEK
jgi:hypothetical protein